MKKDKLICFRANTFVKNIMAQTNSDIRKLCGNHNNSKIARAFWLILATNSRLRNKIIKLVSEFLKHEIVLLIFVSCGIF